MPDALSLAAAENERPPGPVRTAVTVEPDWPAEKVTPSASWPPSTGASNVKVGVR